MNNSIIPRVIAALINEGIIEPSKAKKAEDLLLEEFSDVIADVWHLSDITDTYPNLSEEEALEVLYWLEENSDANIGLNYKRIDFAVGLITKGSRINAVSELDSLLAGFGNRSSVIEPDPTDVAENITNILEELRDLLD